MLKIKNGSQGFTLLELLVVVIIIGILAGIALPQYKMAVLKSKYATMKDIVRVVKEAEQRYHMINGNYTMNFNDLDIDYPGVYNNGTDGSNIKINGGFCSLNWWPYDKGIICIINSTPNISIYDRFGKQERTCRVSGVTEGQTNTIPDKICQMETGKTGYFSDDSNFYHY